ncbi:hypothetical protein EJ08DRAFT_700943 [Tothia fuscella]|uniref:Uncharacterized protein n=1 Tax=Tothia fuscella TaxID=1048955 RepID=A0A9P4NJL1_9PEZI|nr:hypothetical protein EJ08DRAFT_700943 [Tothia fuscella]
MITPSRRKAQPSPLAVLDHLLYHVKPVKPSKTSSHVESEVHSSAITSAPQSSKQDAYPIKGGDKLTTVIVTEIVDVCPTGLTTSTYTTTCIYDRPTGSLSSIPSTVPYPIFTETVKWCTTGCGSKPTSVTVVVPITQTVVSKKTSSAVGGGVDVKPVTVAQSAIGGGVDVKPVAAATAAVTGYPKCPTPIAIVTVTVTVDAPVVSYQSTTFAAVKVATSSRSVSLSSVSEKPVVSSQKSSTSSASSSSVKTISSKGWGYY